MDASTAPPSMMTRTVTLPIPLAEVGVFVGENDSSLMKFVVTKSQRTYVREHGSAGDDMPFVKVSVVITGEFGDEQVLAAECEAANEELLNILERSLSTHVQNYKRSISRKPKNDHKVARLVFKTHMDSQLIGKFIGSSGKNIRMLASELGEICANKGIEASSFRVNIMEEDPDKSPKRFFKIANSSTSNANIIIFVTAQHTGNMRELFLCVRDTMISSVVNCVESANQTHRRDMEPDYDDLYAPEETCSDDSYA